MANAESKVTAQVLFLDKTAIAQHLPEITILTDHEPSVFRIHARIFVPTLLQLIGCSGDITDVPTDLVISVHSEFFAMNMNVEYDVQLTFDGRVADKRLFKGAYRRHQFLVPLATFSRPLQEMVIVASKRKDDACSSVPDFDVKFFISSKPVIWRTLEANSIWLFSTARSGSTWLGVEVLCSKHRARPMDEPGIGRMFAPLQWAAERFFDPESKLYVESGFDYDVGRKQRPTPTIPIFQRALVNLSQNSQILSWRNFDLFHKFLRDMTLEQVLNEWGVIGFNRLVFKCPNESHAADFIMRAFPHSKMIFLIRDGRDVMRSRFSLYASHVLATTKDMRLRKYAIAFYSHFWNFNVDIIRSAFEAHPTDLRAFVRYEDLRREPVSSLRTLFANLGQQMSIEEIEEIANSSSFENVPKAEVGPSKSKQGAKIGGYLVAFTQDEIDLMNTIMGPNLRRYGYL